jgi:hypothetical protein
MRRLADWLARWRVVALLAVPTLTLFGIFNFYSGAVPYLQEAGQGVPPLDIHFFGYGPDEVQSLFTTYDVDGRQRYRLFLLVDLVYAASYGLMFTGLLRMALRPPVVAAASRWNDLCFLPLLAGACDCVENLSILMLLGTHPTTPPALVYLASAATVAKWSLAAAGLVSLLTASGMRLACLVRCRHLRAGLPEPVSEPSA